jgi:hypothetical protein
MSIFLDDLRSGKRVLTAEEIKALYTLNSAFKARTPLIKLFSIESGAEPDFRHFLLGEYKWKTQVRDPFRED